jgi:predicted naringenin-chalcone synthase
VKVIGVGFGRTGTMSLKVALDELGAGPCLHSMEALHGGDGHESASHWARIANGEQIDWREAFESWGSTVDWLGARFYPEMLAAWPQAKVILSVRDPQAWYESCYASLHATRDMPAAQAGGGASPVLRAVDSAIWEGLFEGRFDEREWAIEVFERHRMEVMEAVPAEKLLIYDTRDGWEPLCEFLDVPVPKTPFPHLNGRDAFWTRFAGRPAAEAEPAPPAVQALGSRAAGDQDAAAAAASPHLAASIPVLPRIAGLATAQPETTFDQQQMLELLGLADDEFAQRIFGRCGVQRRRMHLSERMLESNLQGRTAEVEEFLTASAVEAVGKLEIDPQEIGTVVTATLYSLGCPPLASNLIEHFGMDPETDKYHLVGVGCASAVPLLRLAEGALLMQPQKKCLIVGAESMSGLLASASADDTRSKTVGSAIFGDGCGAMLLEASQEGPGPQILASQVHQIPDSLGAVAMKLAPMDSYLHLIRELPDVAGAHLGGLVERFLAASGMTGHMIDHWIIHPGGRRIIECAQEALRLSREEVEISYEVLAERGNVGTPSIFYVIEQTIAQRRPRPEEHGLVVTIGPGVTVGLMLLRW